MAKEEQPQMSKDEQIGYHKGSLTVLAKEREELLKIVQITEHLIGAHIQELEKLGVKLQTGQPADAKKTAPKKKVPVEDLL